MQTTEAQRFIQEVQRVITLGKERSFASFAKKIGKTSQYFTDLKSGKMALTRSVLDQAAEITEIDKEYILIGKKSERLKTMDAPVEMIKIYSTMCETILKQSEVILMQQKTIEALSISKKAKSA